MTAAVSIRSIARRAAGTYHDSHTSALDDGAEYQHTHDNTPALYPPLHTTGHNDDKADKRAQLDDDTKTHQEADGAPHVAERGVLVAVGGARERDAVACLGRTARVQPVGIFSFAILQCGVSKRWCLRALATYRTVGYPPRCGDAGDGHGRTHERKHQAHGINLPARHGWIEMRVSWVGAGERCLAAGSRVGQAGVIIVLLS